MFPLRCRAPYQRRRWATATLALLLLAAGTLISRPQRPNVHSVLVGRWPAALLLDGERAFVANDGDGTLSLLDLTHERLLHTMAIGRGTTLAPLALTLDRATHRLFVADRADDGARSLVHMLDSHSGARLYTVRVGHEAGALAVDTRQGHVVVANGADGTISLLDARTGALLRTTMVGLLPQAVAVDERRARAFVVGPAGANAALPAWGDGAASGLLAMLDTRSGMVLRRIVVGSGPSAVAIDARRGRVFVANGGDGTVSVLDARTGRVLHTVTVGAAPRTLAVDQRRARVFVLNAGDGTLSVLDARTSALRRTLSIERHPRLDLAASLQYALAIDERRDRLYVSTPGPLDQAGVPLGSGLLQIFDTRSGAWLQSIGIGVNPHTIAVAEGSGHIVVTIGGGLRRPEAGWMAQATQWAAGWLPGLGRFAPRPPATYHVPGSVSVLFPTA